MQSDAEDYEAAFIHPQCAKCLHVSWQLRSCCRCCEQQQVSLQIYGLQYYFGSMRFWSVRGFGLLQNWIACSKHLKSKDQVELENNLVALRVQFAHVRSICCLCEATEAKMFSDPFAFIYILLVTSQPCAKIKNSEQSTDRIVSRHRSAFSIQSCKTAGSVPSPGCLVTSLNRCEQAAKRHRGCDPTCRAERALKGFSGQRSERICRRWQNVPPIQVWKMAKTRKGLKYSTGSHVHPLQFQGWSFYHCRQIECVWMKSVWKYEQKESKNIT